MNSLIRIIERVDYDKILIDPDDTAFVVRETQSINVKN